MPDDTPKKSGRGGRRPGAGRPAGQPGKQYAIYLDAASAVRLEQRAQASGVTPYAWITTLVKKNLEEQP